MGFSGWVHIVVEEILRETDKAFLCLIDCTEVWIPKSQIADANNYEEGEMDCEMSITEFIAKEKGIREL